MSDVLFELRHSLRTLMHRPAFALTAILTLALGVGANTTMFSAVYHTLIAPLPFADGDRFAYVWRSSIDGAMSVSPEPAHVHHWRESARLFEAVEPYQRSDYPIQFGEQRETLPGAAILSTLPRTLGVSPLLGRGFTTEERRTDARVVLISEALWRSRYGAQRSVLGQSLTIDQQPHEIVGVMPARFASYDGFDADARLWIPLSRRVEAQARSVNVLAKLKKDVTHEQALRELDAIAAAVTEARPLPGQWKTALWRPQDFLDDGLRGTLPVLFAAVGFVLLIACANVAGLMLIQIAGRRREIAIRSALGASRWRVIAQVAADSVLLAVAGGGAGLLLANWALHTVRAIRPEELVALSSLQMDRPALLFALAATAMTVFLFGTLPALSVLRPDLMNPLNAGGGNSARVTSRTRLRSAIVVGEVAISLVLLIGATLLVRSLVHLQTRDLGFVTDDLLSLEIELPEDRYPTPETRTALLSGLLDGVRSVPGVRDVVIATGSLPGTGVMFGKLELQDQPGRGNLPSTLVGSSVQPEFFGLLGISLLRGRVFSLAAEDARTAVINESMARRFWPGQSALGKQFRMSDRADWITVVGVAEDIRGSGPRSEGRSPQVYQPYRSNWPHAVLIVRTSENTESIVPALRREIVRHEPSLAVDDVATLDQLIAGSIARDRFVTTLMLAFALIGLVLCVVGLYGVVSHAVAQSTREIGVRLAVGATPANIRAWVLTQGARLALFGLMIGSVAAYAVVRLLGGMLHGVQPRDPVSFAAAALLLAAAALIASYLPVRRAIRVDPIEALRGD